MRIYLSLFPSLIYLPCPLACELLRQRISLFIFEALETRTVHGIKYMLGECSLNFNKKKKLCLVATSN